MNNRPHLHVFPQQLCFLDHLSKIWEPLRFFKDCLATYFCWMLKRWLISWITGQNVQKLQIFYYFCIITIMYPFILTLTDLYTEIKLKKKCIRTVWDKHTQVCFTTGRFPWFLTMVIFHTSKWCYRNHLEIKGMTIG